MLRSLADYFFSPAKWGKIRLLYKERAITLAFVVARRLGVSANAAQADNSRKAFRLSDAHAAVQALEAAGSVPAPHELSWRYESDVPVSYEVLVESAVSYAQDTHLSSGRLQTSFDYRLADIPMASFCSNNATHVSVFDAHDTCLANYSSVKFQRQRQRVAFARRHLPIARYYPGLTLNLFRNTENAAGNYGHWIVDGISLLHMALQHYSLDQFDYFLVPVIRYDFQRESLQALGIPASKTIEIPALSCYRFEHLVCGSAPRGVSSGNIPGWLIDGYRQSLLPCITLSTGQATLYLASRRG